MLLAGIWNLEGRESTILDNDGNISSDGDSSSDEVLVCDMDMSEFFGNDQELEEEQNLEEDIVDDKEKNNYMTEGSTWDRWTNIGKDNKIKGPPENFITMAHMGSSLVYLHHLKLCSNC